MEISRTYRRGSGCDGETRIARIKGGTHVREEMVGGVVVVHAEEDYQANPPEGRLYARKVVSTGYGARGQRHTLSTVESAPRVLLQAAPR